MLLKYRNINSFNFIYWYYIYDLIIINCIYLFFILFFSILIIYFYFIKALAPLSPRHSFRVPSSLFTSSIIYMFYLFNFFIFKWNLFTYHILYVLNYTYFQVELITLGVSTHSIFIALFLLDFLECKIY